MAVVKIGFIGLGRMGKAIVLHLLEKGVDVVAFNRSSEKTKELISEVNQLSSRGPRDHRGGRGDLSNILGIASSRRDVGTRNDKQGQFNDTYSVEELINNLKTPRVIWLMVEHGKPVDEMIEKLIDSNSKVSIAPHLRGVADTTPRVGLTKGDI
ncbi:NAD(P)-binding domain-containing protein, partial [Candidatus Gottesmanbacteria bacterium]|nr:NAD(P)-binding domain-containing protein [Candidatus Gottesmanbacteria bacterium]